MKRVLFVESGTTGGGSFESLAMYLQIIDSQKIHPIVVFLNPTRFVSLLKQHKITVHVLRDPVYSLSYPAVLRKSLEKISFFLSKHLDFLILSYLQLIHFSLISCLKKIIQTEQIDLIYLNDQINRDLFGVFVARSLGMPCISHQRSMDGEYFSPQKASLANRYVSAFVSNSQSTKKYWQSRGILHENHHVVYNGVQPIENNCCNVRELFNIEDNVRYLIGSVSRLIPLKGLPFLLRGFSKFIQHHPDSVLLIIGDGPQKSELQKITKELSIADKVIFTGYLQKAVEVIGGLDLLVLTSRYEAFGRVLLEAMQQEIPVVGTNLYGISEIIEHGVNGLLVEYNDVDALCDAMTAVLTDDALRKKFVAESSRTVAEKFSHLIYKQQIDKIILEAS